MLSTSFLPHLWGKGPDKHEAFDRVVLERSPSVVAWATPLEGGPIRALFIAPRFTLRDVGELALRLDLKYEIAPVSDAHHLGTEDEEFPKDKAAERLRARLADNYDLLVVGNLDLSVLPDDVLDVIIAKVKAGCGLLLAHYRENMPVRFQELLNGLAPAEDSEEITRGIGEAITPEWPASLSFVKASKCDQGRVVELNYVGVRPFSHFLLPALSEPLKARPEFFDTYLSLVAKAARWAAGRAPSNWIAEVAPAEVTGPTEEEIPPALPREYIQEMRDAALVPLYHSYQLRLNEPAQSEYGVRAQVREPSRGLTRTYVNLAAIRKGETRYLVDLPIGPGKYFLDLWLLHKKKVVEWHTEPITVKGWPEISDVTWSKGNLLPNDAISVSLAVRTDYHRPRPCCVYARATDALNRIVAEARQPVAAEGGPVSVTLGFADLMSNLIKAELFVTDAMGPQFTPWDLERAAYSCLYLPVRAPRRPNEFSFAIESPAAEEYNVRGLTRTLARFGVDSAVVDGRDDTLIGRRFYLAEMNLRAIPEVSRCAPEASSDKTLHLPCLMDAAFRKEEDKKIKENTGTFWAVGSSVYLLGNGNRLAAPGEDVNLAECYLDGFRQRLKEQYKFLNTLNRAWASQFGSWGNVEPSSCEAAAKEGRYAPWLDYRLYLDKAFCEANVKGKAVACTTDIDGRAGFCALGGSDACLGYDWWLLASQLDALAVEPDPVTVEMLRSYRPANAYSALCFGGGQHGRSEDYYRWAPWYAALHGMRAVWWTAPYGGADSTESAVAVSPNGGPSPAFNGAVKTITELKTGLGTLISSAKRKSPGIAIYGSQASLYLNQADPAGMNSRQSEAAFAKLLENLGLQYDFVSYAQATQGKLEEYALLILPVVRALSEDEIAAIRAFNAKGGRVIADVAPGEFDEHGVRRNAFPLDDTFGVRHNEPRRPEDGRANPPVSREQVRDTGSAGASPSLAPASTASVCFGEGGTAISGDLPGVIADLSVEAEKARAVGFAQGTPVWFVQGADVSFTALLNHPLPPSAQDDEAWEVLARLFAALLDMAGVMGSAQVTPEGGGAFHGEVEALRYGEADVVALLAEPDSSNKALRATIDVGGDWWAYDARAGKALGRSKKVQAKVAPGDVFVTSLLPYEVKALRLSAQDQVSPGRRLPIHVTIETNGPAAGTHLVHVTLQRGTALLAHYTRDVVCTRGEGDTYMPLALNDTPGAYTVTARDVLTGASAKAAVKVTHRVQAPAMGISTMLREH
jgi:hypothetical protein